MATNTISLLALDVGFDLRITQHPVNLPAAPFACKYARDDWKVVVQQCDNESDVATLRRDLAAAGYAVAEPEEEN